MTFEEMVQRTSPYLLCWIDLAMTPKKLTDIGQLRRIKRLADKDFPVPHSEYTKQKLAPIQDFLQSRTGDWAMLEEMTNLQVLEFPKRTPPGVIDDFSFLPKLKNLYRLDLQFTSFTDCSLLSGLTQLKSIALPARKKLIHTEVLDTLSCSPARYTQTNPLIRMTTFLSTKLYLHRKSLHLYLALLPSDTWSMAERVLPTVRLRRKFWTNYPS